MEHITDDINRWDVQAMNIIETLAVHMKLVCALVPKNPATITAMGSTDEMITAALGFVLASRQHLEANKTMEKAR
jgi:hypothetical protein